MDPATKDILDVIAKSVTAIGVACTALGLAIATRVRAADLRWRKMSASRDALSDIHKNAYALEAINMADAIYFKEVYTAPSALVAMTSMDATIIDTFLRGNGRTSLSDDQVAFIRRCFDWFLYYVDRVAYLQKNSMLDSTDFDATLGPYALFLKDRWPYFGTIVKQASYLHVEDQVTRLSKTPQSPPAIAAHATKTTP